VSGGCKCRPISVKQNLKITANVVISECTVCYRVVMTTHSLTLRSRCTMCFWWQYCTEDTICQQLPHYAVTCIAPYHIIIIIIIIIATMFMVLSSWNSHCESSPGSFDECRLSARWPPTLRPNQPIWAVSQQKDWLLPSVDTIAIYYYYSALLLLSDDIIIVIT